MFNQSSGLYVFHLIEISYMFLGKYKKIKGKHKKIQGGGSGGGRGGVVVGGGAPLVLSYVFL